MVSPAWFLLNCSSVSAVRDVDFNSMTSWELFQHLKTLGWEGKVWTAKGSPPPVVVKRGFPKIWWLKPKTSAPSRWYLLCLASLKTVAAEEVAHFQKSSYYKKLIGQGKAGKSGLQIQLGAGMTDVCEDKVPVPRSRKATGSMLEGGGGSRKQAASSKPRQPRQAGQERQVHPKSYSWGPARLTFKPQAKAWQATCPRFQAHAHLRGRKTNCTKTLSFKNDEDDINVQRRLKHWLNQCMCYSNRVTHMHYKAPLCDVPSDEALTAACLPHDFEDALQNQNHDEAEQNKAALPPPKRRRRYKSGPLSEPAAKQNAKAKPKANAQAAQDHQPRNSNEASSDSSSSSSSSSSSQSSGSDSDSESPTSSSSSSSSNGSQSSRNCAS